VRNREQTYSQGNHSQKGAAFLVEYTYKKYVPSVSALEVRDMSCKVIAKMGRYPRCTELGCGMHERWYLRAPGGSYLTVAQLATKALKAAAKPSVLIRLKDGTFVKVINVYDNREVYEGKISASNRR
jgi:hypothetical protein